MMQVHSSKVNSQLNLTYQLTVKLTFENFCSRTLGDLVMTTTYMEQLYTPLTWLGTIYRMTEDSFVTFENFCSRTLGDLVMTTTYMEQLYTPLTWLGTIYRMTEDSFVDMERMFKLLQVQMCVT